uniref:ATP synthase F0 subunit 8 n=1 Tax=Helix pomatia TaxID=6536 RepID=A0A481ZKZ4_HELPO|nr:ATP synthase membrane subunit 8 [Helix pomatia]QBL02351.1 ATP synthase F0 subunit 8 [Helix pomatia]
MPQLSPHNLFSILISLYISMSLLILLTHISSLKVNNVVTKTTYSNKELAKHITYTYL